MKLEGESPIKLGDLHTSTVGGGPPGLGGGGPPDHQNKDPPEHGGGPPSGLAGQGFPTLSGCLQSIHHTRPAPILSRWR